MRFHPLVTITLTAHLCLSASCTPPEPQTEDDLPPTYLGQEAPGMTPEVFGPGLVSTRLSETGLTVSPDGRDVVVSVSVSWIRAILLVPWEDGRWGEPQVAPFSGHYNDWEPVFSPDGRRLYFVSTRPTARTAETPFGNLWYVERTETGWGEAVEVGSPVNSADMGEGYPSITRDGTLYFFRYSNTAENLTEIFRSECGSGTCDQPELLPPQINSPFHDWDPFIAPDESYLIFSSPGRPDGHGDADLYISFRTDDGGWTEAANMGPQVNSIGRELCPFVSHDGKYLFFEGFGLQESPTSGTQSRFQRPPEGTAITYARVMEMANQLEVSRGESYWMDAGIIQELRRGNIGG